MADIKDTKDQIQENIEEMDTGSKAGIAMAAAAATGIVVLGAAYLAGYKRGESQNTISKLRKQFRI